MVCWPTFHILCVGGIEFSADEVERRAKFPCVLRLRTELGLQLLSQYRFFCLVDDCLNIFANPPRRTAHFGKSAVHPVPRVHTPNDGLGLLPMQ